MVEKSNEQKDGNVDEPSCSSLTGLSRLFQVVSDQCTRRSIINVTNLVVLFIFLHRSFEITMPSIVAGIEMGGTGCKVAISDPTGHFDSDYTFQVVTTTSETTLQQIYDWLASKKAERPFVAIGIACFGPIDLDKSSKTYGYITTTPKPGWQYVDVVGAFQGLHVPIAFETDVNAPAMTEAALRGDTSAAYITVGTGLFVDIALSSSTVTL